MVEASRRASSQIQEPSAEEAASFEEAIEIASTWPSLRHEDVMVEVVPEQAG